MSLEVHIYGPGFGETIFLRWRSGDAWRGALIDAYSPDGGVWLAEKLRALELAELDFVLATHPHLDHIEGLAAGLARALIRPKHLFYWPGRTWDFWIELFDRLADQKGGDLKGTAQQVRKWFGFCKRHLQVHQLHVSGVIGEIFSTIINGVPLRVSAIGPWMPGINMLVDNVSKSISRGGKIDYKHRHANHVSVALLLEYGDAQVVLGGDMEDINWNALAERSERPIFRPSLVKVSHHGSSNGRIDGMWPKDGGFFYGLPDNAIAVVTPWRNGDNFLPEENVLQEICEAGYSVYVTGHSGAMGSRSRDGDSHVSVSVESDGAAAVFEQNKVRVLRPPQPEFEI